jgi:hypothetical protein
VHVDDLGHLAQRQRLEVLHALLEELALPVDDVVHHLEHRLPALLDRLDHPVRGVELGEMNSLLSPSNFFLSRAISWYALRQLEARQVRVVEEDVVLPSILSTIRSGMM